MYIHGYILNYVELPHFSLSDTYIVHPNTNYCLHYSTCWWLGPLYTICMSHGSSN